MIRIIPFSNIYQEKTYQFIWDNMIDVLKKELIKLKEELKPLENIEKNYIEGGGNFWLAMDSNKIVGTVGLMKKNNEIYELKRFYIDSDYRRQKIGSKLYNKLELFARKKNVKYIQLNSSKQLKGAHQFYLNNDFMNLNDYDDEKHAISFEKAL